MGHYSMEWIGNSNIVNTRSSSRSEIMALGSNYAKPSSPIMFFLIFHKAILDLLEELHSSANSNISSQQNADMIDRSLIEQYRFLGLIYKYHLKTKYEVILSALNARVKNLVQVYVSQQKCEIDGFDQVFEILNSTRLENEIGGQKEFVSLAETLKQLVTQNMANEEEQIFPLVNHNFSHKEQAYMVWKYLCNIPTYLLCKLLPWLSNSLLTHEYRDLFEFLGTIVPEDKLLLQAILNMNERKDSATLSSSESVICKNPHVTPHPIDEVLLWQKAIKKELNDTFEKIKRMYLSGDFMSQSDCDERLKFIAEICFFHSTAKDKIIFPAIYGETLSFNQHAEEENNKFNEFWNLVQTTKVSHSSAEFYSKLCSCSDQIIETINRHFYVEESQVLPLAREKLNIERQRELLYQSLLMMPLRLIEHVLPWLVEAVNNEEAQNFLHNIQFAAPASDKYLVLLFCNWARDVGSKALGKSSNKRCCNQIKRSFHSHENFSQSHNNSVGKNCSKLSKYGLKPHFVHHSCVFPASEVHKTNLDLSPMLSFGCVEQPIDIIFQVHKAIRRDLEYLSIESGKIRDSDEAFLHQFIGSFCFLWGLYKAHSNSKDNIIYPAIESKEALRNMTHSYALNHAQEEALFEEISCVLSELSQVLTSLKSAETKKDSSEEVFELSTNLQVMCNSIRVVINQHISMEERELWPLLRNHFSEEEQNKMIGFVLGTTAADVLQLLLPWVTSALTQDEQKKMMDTLKNVAKNTMFGDWLLEFSKGNSISMSQTHRLEAFVSQKDDQIFWPRMDNKSKDYMDLFSDQAKEENLLRNHMASHWMASQTRLPQLGEQSTKQSVSFRDPEEEVFGCKHYKRNCKLRAACCGGLFTCNFCHDSVSDHSMDRKATLEMMCMRCLKVQPIGPICKTPSCNGFPMAKYYCNICKLFDDERNIYHCPLCNICRVGKGLGVDYFHCMSCNCCLSIKLVDHKCVESFLCPVCDELLFTSTNKIRTLPCGHKIHSACFKKCESSPNCLICSQSSEEKMKAKSDTTVMVYNHIEKGQMEASSWPNDKSEERVFGFAKIWENRLYPFLLWLVGSFFGRGRVERMIKENRTKDSNVLMCGFVLCSLVVFCVMASLVLLLCLKVVKADKYIYSLPW